MPTNEDAIISAWLAEHGHPELAHVEGRWECIEGHLVDDEGHCWEKGCDAQVRPVPFDFTQPAPLLAAVRVYTEANGYELRIHPPKSEGYPWQVGLLHPWTGVWHGEGWSMEDALRAALAAAIVAEKGSDA